MSLENLVNISLERITTDRLVINKLFNSATRNIKDAHFQEISNENRFDAAYKAIMQLANLALQANGYRTLTSKPGHHMTMIQSLTHTLDIDKDIVIVLDALRKQRHIVDYTGDLVPNSLVKECILSAENLLVIVSRFLKKL